MRDVWRSPVRYAECDQQGVVFNAHYLAWADEAMTAWMERTGTPYEELLARGLDTVLKATALTWSSPARWGESVVLDARCTGVGRTSAVLEVVVRVGERICCEVTTTYVVVDRDGVPAAVPDDLRAAWLA